MKIVTSLSFQGECREAFDFYAKVLGGKVTAFAFRDVPGESPVDPKYQDWLMHAWLEFGDQALMGADMPPEVAPNIDKPKNGFDVMLHTEDLDEARRAFDALAEGGRVGMAFGETFWSPGYGNLTDKFGVPWMVNTNGGPDWKPSQA